MGIDYDCETSKAYHAAQAWQPIVLRLENSLANRQVPQSFAYSIKGHCPIATHYNHVLRQGQIKFTPHSTDPTKKLRK